LEKIINLFNYLLNQSFEILVSLNCFSVCSIVPVTAVYPNAKHFPDFLVGIGSLLPEKLHPGIPQGLTDSADNLRAMENA